MLVSGLTPYEITFIGGFDDSKEEGYGKHQDINPNTNQKETIKAEHLNNIELAIKELRDNSNILVSDIKESYSNLGTCFLAKFGDGSSQYTDINAITIYTSAYKMKTPFTITVYSSDDDQTYNLIPCSGITYTLDNDYIATIQVYFTEPVDFYYLCVHILAPITDVAVYNEVSGIISSNNFDLYYTSGGKV